MTIHRVATAQEFLAHCQSFWMRREIENNLPLGLLLGRKDRSTVNADELFLIASDEEGICATAFLSRGRLLLSCEHAAPELIQLLADELRKSDLPVKALFGPSPCADLLAAMLVPNPPKPDLLMVHALHQLADVRQAAGNFVTGDASHLEQAVEWSMAFEAELGLVPFRTSDEWRNLLTELIEKQWLFFWQAPDGSLVSQAAVMRQTPHSSIIGIVYTPPSLRGKGYGRSCVHAASAAMLQRGSKSCGLFTDLANPISNQIYHQIGYRPLGEFSEYTFIR